MKVNCATFCQLIKLLQEGTRTCTELAEDTGLHKLTVYLYCREFYNSGLIHIAGWEEDSAGRMTMRVYMWGPGKDVKKIIMSKKERTAKYKSRQKHLRLINITGRAA